jgi:hypothetical protein
MAGGPLLPFSAYPVTVNRTYPKFLTAELPETLTWEASLGGNALWRLFYRAPISLPTGTAKLLIAAHANATTGNARFNVYWKSLGANEVPASTTTTAEGVQSLAFATTAYRETQLKVTLDADTIVAGELIHVDLLGETSSWTLAVECGVQLPAIIWE